MVEMVRIVSPAGLTSDINNREGHEHDRDEGNHDRDADPSPSQALAAGVEITPALTIVVIAPAVAPAMRNLSRSAAAQLRLALYFNVFANDRHDCFRCRDVTSNRAPRLASRNPAPRPKGHTHKARGLLPVGDRQTPGAAWARATPTPTWSPATGWLPLPGRCASSRRNSPGKSPGRQWSPRPPG